MRHVQLPAFTRRWPTVLYLILTGRSGEESTASCLMKISQCTDMGVMYVSENNDLQMTTMRWPLTHVRLEGGRMLSEIILFCSKNALSDGSDDGLDKVKKNPYRFNVRRKLLRSDDYATTKIHQKTSSEEVRKVSSIRCCAEKCYQTFDWEDTVRIRRKFHSGSFAARRETGYSIVG
jgi:hypothetical protein